MTLLQNDVSLGRVDPSLRHLPPGRPNELADTALDLAAIAGLELDEWEANTIADSLRVGGDDRWAAREVGVVVARQNGKGVVLEARQIMGLFVLGERLQVHSAHEFKTCYEHFRRVKDLIENCPLLADELLPSTGIRTGAGDQAIELRNGARLRFIARSRTSGVGFSADTVYLDEAFMLDDTTMGALMPTLSARPNSQLWYSSSAPHEDSSVLHRVRRRALAGDDPRLFYVEWGNEPGVDPLDREAWARANPAMGIRIAVDDIAAEQRSMSPAKFARERLGVPDPELAADGAGPISLERWGELVDPDSRIVGEVSTAVDVSPDLKWASVASAGLRADSHIHVEVGRRQPGTDWVVPFAKANPQYGPYRVAGSGPAGFLLPLLAEAEVDTVDVPAGEVTQACARLIAAVDDGTLHHLGSNEIAAALSNATIANRGDTRAWSRIKSSGDISALVAATIAVGGVTVDIGDPQVWF